MKKDINENIIYVKSEDTEYIQFKKLLEYSNILTHCFTIRPLDFGGNDNYKSKKDIVNLNYKKICNSLGIDYKNIVRPYQTHTNAVKTLVEENETELQTVIREVKEETNLDIKVDERKRQT